MVLYDPHGRPIQHSLPRNLDGQVPSDNTVGPVNEKKKASQGEQNSFVTPPTAKRSEAKLEEVPDENKQPYEARSYKQGWWVFGAQVATVIATALAFLAAWRYAQIADSQKNVMELQSLIMNQAFAESRQQSLWVERSAEAALTNARTAEGQLKQMRQDSTASAKQAQAAIATAAENFRTEQRAWVGIVLVNTEGGEETEATFRVASVKIVVRNSGRTPALKLGGECIIKSMLWSDPIPNYDDAIKEQAVEEERVRFDEEKGITDLAQKDPEAAKNLRKFFEQMAADVQATRRKFSHQGGILPPAITQGLTIIEGLNLSVGRKRTLFPGKVVIDPTTLYILGRITYDDVFSESSQHVTKFCLMRRKGVNFDICPEGNWMN